MTYSDDFPAWLPDEAAEWMPLSEFSPEHRAQIAWDVAQFHPPARYRQFGIPGDPRPLAEIENRSWWEWHWARGIDPDKRRDKIPTWLRGLVIERDGYVCGLCEGDVEPTDVHIDHILPVALGGKNEADNLQVAHSLCNMKKGARI